MLYTSKNVPASKFPTRKAKLSTPQLTTHRFVGPAPSQELLLDIWLTEGNRFLYSNNLFPDKTSNVMGKELTVTSFTYLPYAIIDSSTRPIAYEGTEFRLINELSRKINFTWRAVVDEDNMWGEIWENGSGNGIMGSISEDKVDMGVTALYLWYHENRFIDFTFPYYESAVTCLVPKPKQLPAWKLLILPFSPSMWVAVAASLGFTIVSLYIVGKASYSYLGHKRTLCDMRYAFASCPFSPAVTTRHSAPSSSLIPDFTSAVRSRHPSPLPRSTNSYLSLEERRRNPYSSLWKSLFLTVGYVLQQSPADVKDPQAPQNTPLRHLVTWLLFVFLLVASIYSGRLESFLTVPTVTPSRVIEEGNYHDDDDDNDDDDDDENYHDDDDDNDDDDDDGGGGGGGGGAGVTPYTTSDLARSGFLWASSHEAWISTIRYATDPDLKTILRNFRVYTFDELHRKSTTGELAFGVERLTGGHISMMSYMGEDSISTLRLMKGDLYSDHVSLAMRKGSPYMGKINQLIHRLLVSGIFTHWMEEVVKKYMSNRVQMVVLNSAVVVNDGPTKLRIEHIESAFFLLLFGLLFSLIALVLEILRHKYRGTTIRVFF
uniref:Ionotropic glutamate receptor L-glutamate and glycine-binding domain-containing protein n=1 Tax=Timema cristinae TaxID=61476 RepID=A0A7R9CIX2_TIMCR|nr:unnamed protein product [Timema cristinae]